MKFTRFVCLLFVCMISDSAIYAQNNLQKDIDFILQSNFQNDRPGAQVMVWEKGKLMYQNGAGVANVETNQPITSTTTFRMASVSKQFTAMAILLLEKQKKLRFDDKLAKYFPKLKIELSEKITLANLLTHTSGIPDYESLMDTTWKRQLLDEDIPTLLETQKTTYFFPGTKFKYSNTGFCLLALVVQQVSGIPYAQFVKENIFEPLKMNHTFIYDSQHLVTGRGLGYARTKNGQVIPSDQSLTSATKGDGSVYTSANDYLKWYTAIKTNELVNLQAKLSEINYSFPTNASEGYGLGWFFRKPDRPGKYELTHSGSTCGFSNVVLLVPDEDLLIVYFSNIAGNHAVFDEIQNVVKKYTSYSWQTDWNAMHELTD